MSETRIELSDTAMDLVVKMAEGNPGAVRVLCEMLNNGAKIDPDSALGPITGPLSLDTHGIYGSRIWMLYKDVCGQDLTATLGVLRACQLGYIGEATLSNAIDNRDSGIDVQDLLGKVRARLPAFGAMGAAA